MNVRRTVVAAVLAATVALSLVPGSSATPAAPAAAVPEAAAPAGAPVPGYALAWSDEFEGVGAGGEGLDEAEWHYRESEKAICSNSPDNVSVSEGLMRIALRREDRDGKEYTCGGVISKRTFGYGYYETRAQLWGDQGFHSAMWTTGLADYVPDTPEYKGPNNRVNEIDGFEVDSHKPDEFTQVSHWFVPHHVGNPGRPYTGPDSSDGYHTYGFEWTPTEVRYYIDGKLTQTLPKAGPHGLQNIWLTTLGYTSPVDETNLPGETTWDYFRYYAPVTSADDESADAVVVDNGDSAYTETGSWTDEITDGHRQVFGYQDKEVRRSEDPGAAARWTPKLKSAQPYEVFVWNPSFLETGHKAATYTVTHDGGDTDVVVDQTEAGQQWVSLGSYRMTPGAGRGVRLTGGPSGSGVLRADAAKFVPSVVVDNGDDGYREQGTWRASDTVTGWRGTGTRWAAAGSTARWTPELSKSTTYDVYAWLPDSAGDSETVVGTHTSGYTETGRWAASSLRGWDGTPTRTSNDTSATATWRADLKEAGTYKVYAWSPANPVSTTAARFTVTYAGGSDATDVNQTTGGNDWVELGEYEFAAGTGGHVTVSNAARANYLRTNVVKFVRVGAETPEPAAYTVAHAGGTTEVKADTSGGTDRWVRLGNFAFDAGTDGHVELGREEGAQGLMHADAVKFLPAPADDTRRPAAPQNPQAFVRPNASNGDAVLHVRWSPLQGGDVLGHHVYLDGRRITWKPVRRDAFRLYEMLAGQSHKVTVTSVDRSGNESAPSAPLAVKVPADMKPPAPPGGVTAEATNKGAVLYWEQSLEVDLHGYHVYVDGKRITDEPFGNPVDAHLRALGFPVEGLTNNTGHELAVTAVDQAGNESRPTPVRVTPLPMSVIGIEDPAYTEKGTWSGSSVAGWLGSKTRSTNDTSATATWRPELRDAGSYEVFAWVPNHPNSTTAARYTVTHAGGTDAVDLGQTADGNRWISLGTYEFTAGSSGDVTVSNGAGSSYLRTSYVKFVPK
ncbi:glycoside hydrolase family 16 protein [Streptomyces sp. N35]|uniref:glycoside hydrolase family 16 protein n=1 Tax=Streptomyces sp. N35 TaxID=2795730 RepID=UPI0018F68CDE|nr:glycoside hydrolase family 16 protein [Streptomyces sp. N35]